MLPSNPTRESFEALLEIAKSMDDKDKEDKDKVALYDPLALAGLKLTCE